MIFLHKGIIEIADYDTKAYSWNATLEEVNLVGAATAIIKHCFYKCPNLRILNGNSNIVFIGENAMYNCPKLEEIHFPSVVEIETRQIDSMTDASAFDRIPNIKIIDMPKLMHVEYFQPSKYKTEYPELKEIKLNSYWGF